MLLPKASPLDLCFVFVPGQVFQLDVEDYHSIIHWAKILSFTMILLGQVLLFIEISALLILPVIFYKKQAESTLKYLY